MQTVLDRLNGDGHPDIFSTASGNPEHHDVQLEIVAPTTAPRALHASAAPRAIQLHWTPVAGATAYEIWRSAAALSNRRIGRTRAPRFDDRQTQPGVAYTYTVRALNPAGTGPFSPSVRAKRH